MKSLVESILSKRSLVDNSKLEADSARCLAYYIVGQNSSSYGPATGFDLFKFLKSKPLGAAAKPFKDDRLGVATGTRIFNYYKCTGEHNSNLCDWLLKQLVLVTLYSKFRDIISKDNIEKDLDNLSKYLTSKYAERDVKIEIKYYNRIDKFISKEHTGIISINIGTHCSISYFINIK